MNIVIICNSYPTQKNPHNQVFIKNMKEELEKTDGINVDVCYNKIFDIWKGASEHKDIFSNLIKYSVFIASILFFLLKKRKKIDILFPQAVVFPTVFASVIKKFLKKPMVCYVHGGDVNRYPESSSVYKLMMEKALQACNTVIVNSEDLYQKVFDISGHKDIKLISPGVDTNVMRPISSKKKLRKINNLPESKFLLLAAGNAIKRKGFDILLKAILLLEDPVLNKIYLLIITEGPERDKLRKFINTHHLSDWVKIIDKVKQKKLNEYYNAADVFVFPSREEPLGLVGIEAMATGTIVIASNVGGIPNYIENGKNGFLFEKEDAKELSKKIMFVMNQGNDLLHNIYKNMKPVVQSHSLKSSSQKIISLFETLIHKNTY